jgi:cytidylate kinase
VRGETDVPHDFFSVAIDGPSGAGKSTIARFVAKELGFLYVDTGALYRALALMALRHGASVFDAAAVEALLPMADVRLSYEGGELVVFLNGEDVTDAIRAHEISQAASNISKIPAVRAYLLDTQRAFSLTQNVIMDGRDIGTVVLPDADVKIFLTADPAERAGRRFLELRLRDRDIDYETVLADVIRRDENDSHRDIAPLRPADNAIVLDTTGNTWETSMHIILDLVKGKLASCSTKSSTEL